MTDTTLSPYAAAVDELERYQAEVGRRTSYPFLMNYHRAIEVLRAAELRSRTPSQRELAEIESRAGQWDVW